MARVAVPSQWAGALVRQRGPLRVYQWLWLVLCVVGAFAAAAPRLLQRPYLYTSSAAVQVDTARYSQLFAVRSDGRRDFDDVRDIAGLLLSFDTPELNRQPLLQLSYAPQGEGVVLVTATVGGNAPNDANAARAQTLANTAAEALARSVRAAGGREIFRRLVGWEEYAAFQAAPPRTPFQQTLRDIQLYNAFPLNRPVDIVSEPFTVDQLAPEDMSDLARAFEVQETVFSRADLPAARGRLDAPALTAEQCAAAQNGATQAQRDVCRMERGLVAIRQALTTLQNDFGAGYAPLQPSAVYQRDTAAPAQLVPRNVGALLALTLAVGLVFGGVGVAVDRSAGVMAKLRELWAYRELIRNLVLRDLRVRYKGSALGYLWTQLAPLMLMLVFLFVFTVLMPNGIAMFPVFLLVGLLPWNFCNEAIAGGARSVIDNASLIKKVFFPREVLPLVSVFSSLVNYLLSLPMMFLVMGIAQWIAIGRLNFSWTFAYLPVLLIIQTLFLAGMAFFMSALAVSFRDFVHLIGILLQFWFFLTPVVYSLDLSINPQLAQAIRWLNPMASLIDFYRGILYGGLAVRPTIPTPGLPALDAVLRVLVTSLLVLALGYCYFQRKAGNFGERI